MSTSAILDENATDVGNETIKHDEAAPNPEARDSELAKVEVAVQVSSRSVLNFWVHPQTESFSLGFPNKHHVHDLFYALINQLEKQ